MPSIELPRLQIDAFIRAHLLVVPMLRLTDIRLYNMHVDVDIYEQGTALHSQQRKYVCNHP